MNVLIIEDDAGLHETLTEALADIGLDAQVAVNGEEALEMCGEDSPDLILLDLGLPDIDGIDVCRRLRQDSVVPIIIITGRRDDVERVVGLEVGADDYIVKPFKRSELVARVRALLRRVHEYPERDNQQELSAPPVHVWKNARRVTCYGEEVDLTPKEYELLCALASRPNEVISSDDLLWEVWEYPKDVRTRTLDVHIGRLRGKLERDRGNPEIIITIPGVGYKLETEAT